MALSAGESFSGGQVRDSKSRSVIISETTNAAVSAGEFYSAGFLCDPDSRTVICQDAAHSALVAGETLTGGDVRDKVGRIACAVETLNAPVSAGSQFSDGWLNDSQGRRIIALDTLGAALVAGEQFTSGQVRDSVGRLVLASEGGGGGGSAYDTLILADTPVGYWPLSEPSGTTALDKTANANNGTYSGLLTLGSTALLSDGATSCNFTGGQMAVPDAAPLRLGAGTFSVEMWVNLSTMGAWATVCDNTARAYSLMLNAGAANTVLMAAGGQASTVTTSATLATATRYHLVVTAAAAGGAPIMYVNGVNVGVGASGHGAVNSATGVTWFGNPSGGGSIPQGRAAKLAVYNYVLTPTQISAHFAAG